MYSKMLEHLRGRLIAPILETSNEKFNSRALKMMCILDHELEQSGLYLEMTSMPKLKLQLLNLHSFASFKYFKYTLMKEAKIDNKILKCKQCEVIGPYLIVLEHMAINHDFHASAQLCMWCEKVDYQTHSNTVNTLDHCYENYLRKQQFSSTEYPAVIVSFYNLLEGMAKKLRARTIRREDFKSAKTEHNETILVDQSDDSMSSKIVVSKQRKRYHKGTDNRQMEKLYQRAMYHFHKDNIDDYVAPNMNAASSKQPIVSGSGMNQLPNFNSPLNIGINTTRFTMTRPSPQFDSPSSTSQFSTMPPPPTVPEFQSMPLFGVPPPEIGFANFISSVLNNIRDKQLKKRAKLEIKSIIYKYSVEDVNKQMTHQDSQDSDDSDSD